MEKMKTKHNTFERRCPMLGGPVGFPYCETCGADRLPCPKIFDCWWETFNVQRYLKDNLSEKQFTKLMNSKPNPKIRNIIELAEQAKKRNS